ncbi:hypothetical protein B0A48_18346 [Cryoendolithus antarcticus]|uniref:Uncharacterized protein n=1 Tax=Cryoendolithus antarcticus TaxID=1507870 RepID=A0A1V8SB11_9PEZI|nr:hypothetical protein B0A48_18346 [Cryoendolithus antarcticus]
MPSQPRRLRESFDRDAFRADLDYFLNADSFGRFYEPVRSHIEQLIQRVGQHLGYISKWANDEVRLFLSLLNDPEDLFRQSKEQGVILYRDDNLIIYAVLWEWVLVRKLKRLQMEAQPPRKEDWNDCVAITKLLHDRQGGGLRREILTRFDHTTREPPVEEKTVADLRRLVAHFYRVDAFPNDSDETEDGVADNCDDDNGDGENEDDDDDEIGDGEDEDDDGQAR